ncbi:MAG: hypothetical protein EBR34_01165 [Sphingomonadaceae bacterium]|nr:hypothetical protein [Sphingomonadaceae bacterium]
MIWLTLSAIAMAGTAVIHSVAGERRLLGPALASRTGVFARPQARGVFRGAWHLTSLFMALTAAVMVWPQTAWDLKALVAAVWLAIGLYSLVSTRGRHVGWPSLIFAGVTGLIGSLS